MDFLELAQRLVSIESVTSQPNARVAEFMHERLTERGFDIESLAYKDNAGLEKIALVARRGPSPINRRMALQSRPNQTPAPEPTTNNTQANGGVVFCCHNDVVSVDGWNAKQGGPFDAAIADGRLWGRGACDMKGPIAAALAATEQIPIESQRAPIYFLVTGDEESGMQGAATVVSQSKYFAEMKSAGTVGIIGEPTELQVVNAHKGGCHLKIVSHGIAAHSSTADGVNANWAMIPFLSYLREIFERTHTDPKLLNSQFAPPTLSMNVILKNEPSAANITVGRSTCQVFLRPMPNVAWRELVAEIVHRATELGLEVAPFSPLEPLHTPATSPFVQQVLRSLGQETPQSVCYATDGCCLRDLENLIVLGPGSIEQAHRPDEWIAIDQLQRGVAMYERLFRQFAVELR